MSRIELSLVVAAVFSLLAGSSNAQVVVDMPSPPPTTQSISVDNDNDPTTATASVPPQASRPAGAASMGGYLGRARPRMSPGIQTRFMYGSGYGYGGYPYGYWGRGYPLYGYGFGYWGLGHGHHSSGHGHQFSHGGTHIGGFRTIGHFSHQSSNFGIHIDF